MEAKPLTERELLRHMLATLAYRGSKAVRGAPPGFGAFEAGPGTRTPVQILAHIGDLLDWACELANGSGNWHESAPQPWDGEVARFFEALSRVDARLSSIEPVGCSAERLLQGPVADALTHVGQIGLLRRLSGAPVKGENYLKAEIKAGRVGREHAPPRLEFD